ncbi:MAG: hypothetical protein MUC87_06520 [Bacteroidia bacterium]|jgi:hypothetical protein|nr:hypothetical protein [Bacteroidia bacterium]
MEYTELINTIHKADFNINKHNLSAIDIDKICAVPDKFDFMKSLFENFDSRFCEGLLLTCPCLWTNFTLKDWEKIIVSISPRVKLNDNITFHINNNSGYADVIFIRRYFNIDIENLIEKLPQMLSDDKKKIRDFISFYDEKICKNKNEITEDLNDFYNISFEELSDYVAHMK